MPEHILHSKGWFAEWSTVVDGPVVAEISRLEADIMYPYERVVRAIKHGCSALRVVSLGEVFSGNRAGRNETELSFADCHELCFGFGPGEEPPPQPSHEETFVDALTRLSREHGFYITSDGSQPFLLEVEPDWGGYALENGNLISKPEEYHGPTKTLVRGPAPNFPTVTIRPEPKIRPVDKENDDLCSEYEQGHQAAMREVLGFVSRSLPRGFADRERAETVSILRALCSEHGDNNWDDDLHLVDVISKHLDSGRSTL